MSHFGISGVFPICGCIFLLSVCVFILWASEHGPQVWRFIDFIITRFLGPLAAPSPEEDADYERF
jgi:hypothetical protein